MKTLRYLAVVAMVAAGCGNRSANLAEKDIVLNDTLSRSELVKMDVLTQHNIVSELSPEKKFELYDYKLKKDLETVQFTDVEAALLKDLRSHLSAKIYSDEAARAEFQTYSKSIEDKLRDECGWDDEKVFRYLETVMTSDEAEPMIAAKKKAME